MALRPNLVYETLAGMGESVKSTLEGAGNV